MCWQSNFQLGSVVCKASVLIHNTFSPVQGTPSLFFFGGGKRRATPGNVLGLLLALCSGINLSSAQGTISDARDRTWDGYMQGKRSTSCTVLLAAEEAVLNFGSIRLVLWTRSRIQTNWAHLKRSESPIFPPEQEGASPGLYLPHPSFPDANAPKHHRQTLDCIYNVGYTNCVPTSTGRLSHH